MFVVLLFDVLLFVSDYVSLLVFRRVKLSTAQPSYNSSAMALALKNTETEPVPTHRGAHPKIAPSATRSAPPAEPNEADLLPALDSGLGKLLSTTEVESTLKDWPTQEQASLKEQMARSNTCLHPTTTGSSERAIRCSAAIPIPRMQVCAFDTKMLMATRSSDDDEDMALPRIPWQMAAGPAWLYDRYHRLRFGEHKYL